MKKQQRRPKTMQHLAQMNFGSAIYRIEYEDRLLNNDDTRRLSGAINHAQCVIKLDPNADPQSVADTIVHESIHFFLAHCGQEGAINPDRLEDVVQTISNGMMTIMRLNPGFVKLIEEL